jgi:DNA-binding transcriptional LysR family regulator
VAFTPLNSLHAYLSVARRLSFAAAASELGVSTSALSQSVRLLEERLGVTLLRRTSRSVALTDAGQRLLENAGPGVTQALESLKTVAARPGEVTGRIRLSVPNMSVKLVVAPLLLRFLSRYPRVEVDLRVEDRFVDIVRDGLDAGIRLSEAIERDMVTVRLYGEMRFVLAASPKYLERKGVPEKPPDLLTHDCIGFRSPTSGGIYAWELERGKKSWRVPVQGPVTTNDEYMLKTLAEAGHGIIYMCEPLIAAELKRGSLQLVLEPYSPSVPGLFLYFPSRAQVSPALRAFVSVARELIADRKPR